MIHAFDERYVKKSDPGRNKLLMKLSVIFENKDSKTYWTFCLNESIFLSSNNQGREWYQDNSY